MGDPMLWYAGPKPVGPRFRWLFFGATVAAVIMVFLPYVDEYTPLRASLENLADMRTNFADAWTEPQALALCFFCAIPLLLWRSRKLFFRRPPRIELLVGGLVAFFCALPITVMLVNFWAKAATEWGSMAASDMIAGLSSTVILLMGMLVFALLLSRHAAPLAVQAAIIGAYAANLLLCSIIFRPFGDDFLTGQSSVGYYVGLPVLLLMLVELLMLGLYGGRGRAVAKEGRRVVLRLPFSLDY